MDEHSKALAEKGMLILTVKLENTEQADELLRWMYSKNKPMKSELLEIAWDKVAVPRRQAEALIMLSAAFKEGE
jgi:hypothetical protein